MIAKKFRFHGYGSLKFVYSKGRVSRTRYMSLKSVLNPKRPESRLAVVVSKKVSKRSPERNRIRRRIYEAVRLEWPRFQLTQDMVITVFDERVATISDKDLKRSVHELLAQSGVFGS